MKSFVAIWITAPSRNEPPFAHRIWNEGPPTPFRIFRKDPAVVVSLRRATRRALRPSIKSLTLSTLAVSACLTLA